MIISERKLRILIKKELLKENGGLSIGTVIDDFIDDMSGNDIEKITAAIKKNSIIIQLILSLLSSNLNVEEEFRGFYDLNFPKLIEKDSEGFFKKEEDNKDKDISKIKNYLDNFIKNINNSKSGKSDEEKSSTFKNAFTTFKNALADYIPSWLPLQFLFYNINKDNFSNILTDFVKNDDNFEQVTNTFWVLKDKIINQISGKFKEFINKSKFKANEILEILADTFEQGEFSEGVDSLEGAEMFSSALNSVWNLAFQGSDFNPIKYGNVSDTVAKQFKNINKSLGLGDILEDTFKKSWEDLQADDGKKLKELFAPNTVLGQLINKILNQQEGEMTHDELGKAVASILKVGEEIKSGMGGADEKDVTNNKKLYKNSYVLKKNNTL